MSATWNSIYLDCCDAAEIFYSWTAIIPALLHLHLDLYTKSSTEFLVKANRIWSLMIWQWTYEFLLNLNDFCSSHKISDRWSVDMFDTAILPMVDEDIVSLQSVKKGIPQGKVLGPTLSELYKDDLLCTLNHCKGFAFADDIKRMIAVRTPGEFTNPR